VGLHNGIRKCVKHINLEKVHKTTKIGSRITTDFKIMVVINKVFREISKTWIISKESPRES
jgi:serine acetyltransferase